MLRAGIQADDLTGACDTGAVFAARGFLTVVLLPAAPLPAHAPEVLVLDTESRGRPAAEARATARAAAARLVAVEPALVYKKVDSTLRGPLTAELAGALEGTGRAYAILAPAFPAQGRTVVDGLLRIDGRLASETAIAADPGFPATGASVLALLGAGGPRPASLVPLGAVRRGARAVAARVERFAGGLVCDAETDADLATVATAVEDRPALLAGSAGFAAALAARLPARPGPGATRPRLPLLVVAGTAHPATRCQLAELGERPGVRVLAAPEGDTAARTEGRETVVERLAAIARETIARAAPGTLLLTGGETAYSVCRALGATGIVLTGQIEPGLAVGTLRDGPFAGLPVITKAGGFGDPETLVRVLDTAT